MIKPQQNRKSPEGFSDVEEDGFGDELGDVCVQVDGGGTHKQGGKRGRPHLGRTNFCELSWSVPKGEGKVQSPGKGGTGNWVKTFERGLVAGSIKVDLPLGKESPRPF